MGKEMYNKLKLYNNEYRVIYKQKYKTLNNTTTKVFLIVEYKEYMSIVYEQELCHISLTLDKKIDNKEIDIDYTVGNRISKIISILKSS